ncbi:MAG: serine/threonine protein kinase [Synechococcales cyanobacterium M58_A2018_015]|nr:serine/threonine protein kinase [Synechococcales cyanobacterium M58_A2018_015]
MLGRVLGGRYRIIQHLGSGGFGQTFLAVDQQLPSQPLCVVKQLQPRTPNPFVLQTAKRLFDAEAEVLYRLGNRHEQIPQLFAHFEENQEFYLVQEFIEGTNLSEELIPGNPWTEDQVIELLKDILGVLAFVHSEQVIHRDIKPENLIRRKQNGKIALIDFGAVKEVVAQGTHLPGSTRQTIGIGTPGYMPSEQAAGKPKCSSDVYAVGIIGIQALTGLLPQHFPEDPITGELRWQSWAQASAGLIAILERMTRYHFSERYSSAQEALQAVEQLQQKNLAQSLPQSLPQTVLLPPSHSKAIAQSLSLQQHSLRRSELGWNFWVRFVIATYLGPTIGTILVFVSAVIFFLADKYLLSGFVFSRYKDNLQLIAALIAGPVMGLCVGVAEWLAMRRWISGIAWWIPASVFSSTLIGFAMASSAVGLWSKTILGALGGVTRWAVLREKAPRAKWLIPWFMLSSLIGPLRLYVIDLSIRSQSGPSLVVGILLPFLYTSLMVWILRRQ